MLSAFNNIVKNQGYKGLFKGFTPAITRSIPANAVCFLGYEKTKEILFSKQ
jgi:solute carrier family 25 carnitine/acylcarnitine transporter 20/29